MAVEVIRVTWPDTDRVSDQLVEETNTSARHYYLVLGVVGVIAIVGLVALSTLTAPPDGVVEVPDDPQGALAGDAIDPAIALRNPSILLPDFNEPLMENQVIERLELGLVEALPGDIRLDFLIDSCEEVENQDPENVDCYLDAAFVSSRRPDFRSGPGEAGEPFHVRQGFANEAAEPLGPGFDVVIYMVPTGDSPGESRLGGELIERGRTVRFSSDYVIRGESDRCGPNYDAQTEPVICEWFVHDFPQGLPEGRYDMWAVWQAPCWAWIELGFTDHCPSPDRVVSFFSSGVNSPIEAGAWTGRPDDAP